MTNTGLPILGLNQDSDDSTMSVEDDMFDKLSEPRMNKIITLDNGQRVSVADVGDSAGVPVIFCLGLSGSRQFALCYDDIAREHHIRLIYPDRPGIGMSDDVPHEDRTVLKWADSLFAVTDKLGIDKFGLIAQSCGAVYALAIAYKYPDRILGDIQLMSPWVSLSTPGASRSLKMAQYVPGFMLQMGSNAMQSVPRLAVNMGSVNMITSGWSVDEKRSFEKSIKHFFKAYMRSQIAENASGYSHDIMISLEKYHPFGFDFHQVEVPVHCYHGDKDSMVPIDAVRWITKTMKNCKLTEKSHATHNLIMDLDYIREVIFPAFVKTIMF